MELISTLHSTLIWLDCFIPSYYFGRMYVARIVFTREGEAWSNLIIITLLILRWISIEIAGSLRYIKGIPSSMKISRLWNFNKMIRIFVVPLLFLGLCLSCMGQTFQYSRGWTNGKRSSSDMDILNGFTVGDPVIENKLDRWVAFKKL